MPCIRPIKFYKTPWVQHSILGNTVCIKIIACSVIKMDFLSILACPYSAEKIINSIESIKCDAHWKTIIDYPEIGNLLDTNEFFIDACKRHTICLGCVSF